MIAAVVQDISASKKETVLIILAKIALQVVFGTLSFSKFPIVINIIALGAIVLILLNSLIQKDHFSFFLQMFFCNHFVFGNDNGGLYNLAGMLALFSYYLLHNRGALQDASLFGKLGYAFLVILFASEVIAVVANDRIGNVGKVTSIGVFTLMLAVIYQLSKIRVTYQDYIRFIYVLFFFTCYNLAVAANQQLYLVDLPVFPSGNPDAEFELGLLRSGGAMLNYEAYGEYSLSLIALLLPGILSGSIQRIDTKLFIVSLSIIIISLFAIVLSGTRSSLLLLPLLLLFILTCLGRRLKLAYLVTFFALATGAFILNLKYKFVDVNIFAERSANMDLEHMSIKDLISGGEMNRGEIFEYAFKKIGETKGLIGAGYFTKEENYVVAHFDRLNYLPTDYHNLYLSSIVLWGIIGAIALLAFFFISTYQGIIVYFRNRHIKDFSVDMLLGFNALFLFFIINEYKIQFIRFPNYFILIFLFLVMYRSLIKNVNTGFEDERAIV